MEIQALKKRKNTKKGKNSSKKAVAQVSVLRKSRIS